MNHIAILLFSKMPQAGLVKTRLTNLKDGYLDPQQACELYKAMLFDVYDCCWHAINNFADSSLQDCDILPSIFISAPGIEQAKALNQLFIEEYKEETWPPRIIIHDEGKSFDEHYNFAFEQIWSRDFDAVLSMGCDMPCLRASTIEACLKKLNDVCNLPQDKHVMILSPDQEMGVSIVGWDKGANLDHSGVFYNKDGLTVLPAYTKKAQENNIPIWCTDITFDVDTIADLYTNATMALTFQEEAKNQKGTIYPKRFVKQIKELALDDIRIMPNTLFDPRDKIDT
ncbi:MAG: DUF2064 domain-containing protein [Coriobacteriales bacterium]|nr:DUF2064 domain-containing protein [Coriobacteriales bacterium]